ncbi:hypothetical protein COU54_01860 [Candidatus Pacearchaeota archaeon CG10_big_fil_rev_8_21_14_0_10_31_24]|nr:MAG: hypothetical protein COU54_01860 [Candidatus Pacearchaeota archaeon CG10_big_fil_rev_8_21_14_0_10_31_24]
MKLELVVKLWNFARDYIRKHEENNNQINKEYERRYVSCFEGTPEQIKRKLEIWDEIHITTREHYDYKGGLYL